MVLIVYNDVQQKQSTLVLSKEQNKGYHVLRAEILTNRGCVVSSGIPISVITYESLEINDC